MSTMQTSCKKELKKLRNELCHLMFDVKDQIPEGVYIKMGELLRDSRNREETTINENRNNEEEDTWHVDCTVVYVEGEICVPTDDDYDEPYVKQITKTCDVRIPHISYWCVKKQIEDEHTSCFNYMLGFAEYEDDELKFNDKLYDSLVDQIGDDDFVNKAIIRITKESEN